MIAEALQTIVGFRNAVSALSDLSGRVRQWTSEQERQGLLAAIRGIYFHPNGVLQTLKEISEGVELDREKSFRRLENFELAEYQVSEALSKLKFDSDEFTSGLSLRQKRELQEMAWQKMSLRSELSGLLQAHLSGERQLSQDDAAEVRAAIIDLNTAIEVFEEAVIDQ